MKEIRDIVQAYDRATMQNQRTAMATVVKVDGSSYRRPGARMLVTEDGSITGGISGDCLEGDALQKAQFAIFSGENKFAIYDSTDEDDIQFGLHLGCNGVVYILFEPIKKEDPNNPVELLRRIYDTGEDAVIVTIFSQRSVSPLGTRVLYLTNNLFSSDDDLQPLFSDPVKLVYNNKQSAFLDVEIYNEKHIAFIEYIDRPVSIVIVGAGNDVQPLVQIATMLGWSITILDGRYSYALPKRFPGAAAVLYSRTAEILSLIKTDSRTIFLLMSHNYNYDFKFLTQIVKQDFGYIGLLGPAQKRNRMLSDLGDLGTQLSERELSKVHGPVGLDIGAENSTEIALSIVTEIKAFLSGKSGSPLKLKNETIHERLINSLPNE